MRGIIRRFIVQPLFLLGGILSAISMLPALIAECIADLGYNDDWDQLCDRMEWGRGIGRDA